MASAKYDQKRQGWWLTGKDFQKEKEGHKHPYFKKWVTDRFYPNLGKKAQERKMAEMVNEATKIENATISAIKYSDRNKTFIAWEYFNNVEKVSGSTLEKTVQRNKWIINDFANWLKRNYPKLMLHQLSRQIAQEYALNIRNVKALSTVKTFIQVISWIMKQVLVATEDSDLKYRNPFIDFDFSILEAEPKVRKAIFTVEQMRQLIEPVPPTNLSKTNVYKVVHEVFYMLFMTGWRVSDVVSINPSTDIDWEKRTLSHIHGKTKKKGTKTILYLTPRLYDFLYERREQTSLWPKYKLYSLRKACLARITNLGFVEVTKRNKQTINAYCVHSTRGSVITWLKNANFNNDRIEFYVGHATQSVEGRSYNQFLYTPKEATEDLQLYLEKLLFEE
jgi:integrase